jgi:Family of unknown function (DUF6308)
MRGRPAYPTARRSSRASSESTFALHVERLDGELLVLDGLGLARGFFAGAGSPDAPIALGDPSRIELDDVMAMNRTMRSRSPHSVWADVVEADTPWLAALPLDLDLLELDDDGWTAAGGDDLVSAALAAMLGPGRGMAVATKLLHLKRPRLFPMLDRFVAEMLGLSVPDGGNPQQRVDAAVRLTRAIRDQGRRNLAPLRRIRDSLAADGSDRSLVRIFDAILWFAHPAAGVAGSQRLIEVRRRAD